MRLKYILTLYSLLSFSKKQHETIVFYYGEEIPNVDIFWLKSHLLHP